jgi:hypothetical protein
MGRTTTNERVDASIFLTRVGRYGYHRCRTPPAASVAGREAAAGRPLLIRSTGTVDAWSLRFTGVLTTHE